MSSQPPLVYILTLNWNKALDTAVFLGSCATITYTNFRVVVIDNGSEAGSLDPLMAQFPATEWLVNQTNLGFAAGMNVGIRYAMQRAADFVYLVNNDTLLAPEMLDQLVGAAIAYEADIASPAIYYLEPPERIWSIGGWRSGLTLEIKQCHRCRDMADLGEPFVVDYVTACGMLLRRQCVERVGLFDERFFMYYEDLDYCLRARTLGSTILVTPRAKMWHKVSASIGGHDSPAERYHMALSSVSFFKKHVHGGRWFIVGPYRTASALKTTARLLGKGRLDSALAYVRGLREGICM